MASYPTSVVAFTTKNNGPGNTIDASHVNDLQSEVTAIETDLITGLPVARGGTGATTLTANRVAHTNAGGTALASTAGFTFDGTTLTAPATTITAALTPQALVDVSGASAGQIQFPATQNASADVNTLDDYEEGSWTPSIGGSGGQSGQVYTVQVGRYIKIGKLVMCQFRVTLSTLGTVTTSVQVHGLPFSSENTTNNVAICPVNWFALTTAMVYVSGVLNPNTTAITLLGTTAAATGLTTALVQGDLSNTTTIDGTLTYRAAA